MNERRQLMKQIESESGQAPIVYVTKSLRDAEELASGLGYYVVAQKAVSSTFKGEHTIQEFIVCPTTQK